jgi:hypothetical protein
LNELEEDDEMNSEDNFIYNDTISIRILKTDIDNLDTIRILEIISCYYIIGLKKIL